MSFEGFGFDIGIDETKRRRRKSSIPDFTGDIDLESLSRGVPFPSSQDFGKRATQRNLLAQRGRIEQTPLRLRAEGNLQDAFLTDPSASPSIDPTRKSNGKKKKSRLSRSRSSLLKESRRLARGGQPRNQKQADRRQNRELDQSFGSLIVD